mmetsp:Transcript_43455/g.120241  ORF Transcript_43455/g.120241 Transcript_43455/m.120241 type:complete len:129 (+) Transcript_43455:494-880(+)
MHVTVGRGIVAEVPAEVATAEKQKAAETLAKAARKRAEEPVAVTLRHRKLEAPAVRGADAEAETTAVPAVPTGARALASAGLAAMPVVTAEDARARRRAPPRTKRVYGAAAKKPTQTWPRPRSRRKKP